MRVIDGDHRTRPVREDPEPEPARPRRLEALGLAAAAGARRVKEALAAARAHGQRDVPGSARAQRLREAAHSARARAADGLGGRERRLGFGALAVGLIGLVLVAGLSAGSGSERQRIAGPPPQPAASQPTADSEAREARDAREAREARRRMARRRRAAAQKRREERTAQSSDQAPAHDTSPYSRAPTTDVVCPEDVRCVSKRSLEPRLTHDHETTEQSDRETVDRRRVGLDRPRVRIDFDDESGGGVDVDVDVPEFD